MTHITRARGAVLVVSLLSCTACVATVRAPAPRAEIIFAEREPPPERVEVIPAAPGEDFVWTKGHWAWQGSAYAWIPGRWVKLEAGFREWVPGRWEHEQRGWVFVEGHFAAVTYVNREPPPLREEVVVARPGPAYVWIKGHWDLRAGEFEWVAGRWARPEPGFHEWVAGRWAHEPRGWFYVEGHWR